MENYGELLFINDVRELQNAAGTGEKYEKFYVSRTNETLEEGELQFIAARDSFYIASVSSTGWPYVQHRGGPKGFLKQLDANLLGFADYVGNKQFITMGHAAHDDRVSLFLMDYEHRSRLKILGRMKMQSVEDADPKLVEKLAMPGQGVIERVATIEVVATDWNCPKYIPQLVEMGKVKQFVTAELQQLQAENAALKAQIAQLQA